MTDDEVERLIKNLSVAKLDERDALEKIKVFDDGANGAVRPGKAVETNQGNFYISISGVN